MDRLLSDVPNTALVILAFLQADCRNAEYKKELVSLGSGLNFTRDINSNGPRIDLDDGYLETDGHPISSDLGSFNELEPSVDLQWLRNQESEAAQQIAEELRGIADQLEHSVVAQATGKLSKRISAFNYEKWNSFISEEVEWVMRHTRVPQHLPEEQVIVALTLTLVKGVCQHAPQFLKNLFNAALQYIELKRAR